MPLRVGLVAGETSGDTLGAALIQAIRARVPDAQFFGMAGPKMVAQGCEAWASSDQLSVMGLFEVLTHLPRLLSLRKSLVQRFLRERPDVVVGIDVPDFNLGLEKKLKAGGLRTVQYVSPQVWAWRQGRVKTIGQSTDLVLCLLPFETEFYSQHGVRAEFVGHPLADQIPLEIDRPSARQALGLEGASVVVALLPGSRMGEVERLGSDFISAAAWIAARRPGTKFVAPMASARVRELFLKQQADLDSRWRAASVTPPDIQVLEGQAQRALAAADGVIVASGTATLETTLSKRPMVVAYRLGALTAFILKRLGLVKVPYFSQPNLLLGRRRVPEFFQDDVTGEALGEALLEQISEPSRVTELQREFQGVHQVLRRGGADRAAAAILDYVRRRSHMKSPRPFRLAPGREPGGVPAKPARGMSLFDELTNRHVQNYRVRVAGIDEAGRGPLAGPVVAAAVILDPNRPIRGLADSKQLSAEERDKLAPKIRKGPWRGPSAGPIATKSTASISSRPRCSPCDAHCSGCRCARLTSRWTATRYRVCTTSTSAAPLKRSSAAMLRMPRSAPHRFSRRRRATR